MASSCQLHPKLEGLGFNNWNHMSNSAACFDDIELLTLLRGYSALIPPAHLTFPLRCSFTEAHAFLLHQVLLDSHLEQYPPSERYQQAFWKWVIEHLERMNKGEEVCERVAESTYSFITRKGQRDRLANL